MSLLDIPRFLLFRRSAILRIARTPLALFVGLLLVLTASIARNYDGADLIAEWPTLLHGLGVSTFNALALLVLVVLPLPAGALKGCGFWPAFVVFLALFWMTSPMAWLYAIPWEQFLRPVEALEANVWTLALVSVWRVALITRVLQVLFDAKGWRVLAIVLAYSDLLVFLGAQFGPAPIIDFMGGMQYSEEEKFLADLNFSVLVWSILLLLPLIITMLVAMRRMTGRWALPPGPLQAPRAGVWAMLVLALIGCGVMLAIMQPQQQNRHQAEALLRGGRVAEGIAFMASRPREDFPKIWDPPPRRAYRDDAPSLAQIRDALKDRSIQGWVREVYLLKSWRNRRTPWWPDPTALPSAIDAGNDARARVSLEASEDLAEFLRFHLEHDTRFTEQDRQVVAEWIELVRETIDRAWKTDSRPSADETHDHHHSGPEATEHP